MHTVASLSIPQFYSAYRLDVNRGAEESTGSHKPDFVQQAWYSCERCKTRFAVFHKWASGMFYGGGHFDDSLIYCPYCGYRHENFPRRENVYHFSNRPDDDTLESVEAAPRDMTVLFMEYQHGFILRVTSKSIAMRLLDEGGKHEVSRYFGNRVEEIRFDLHKQETTFSILTGSHRVAVKKYEIGNPFDSSFYADSMLRHIRSDNLSEQNHAGTVAFMKTIREHLRRKWKQLHGYDIGSIFVSYGQVHGRVLFPLMNLAFRVRFPDAPNLPQELNGSKTDIEMYMTAVMFDDDVISRYFNLPKKLNSITAVIQEFHLPDKPMVRKLLATQFFAAPELTALFKVTTNLDCARQVWDQLRELAQDRRDYVWTYANRRLLKDIYPFLQRLAEHYPIRSIISLLKREEWGHLMDMQSMLNRLTADRVQNAWKVKLKALHDWMTQALLEQRKKGYELTASDVIKRRLAMQVDSLKFFLPEHTKELDKASQALRNCVHTYGERVKEGRCNIVLMTDDRGKLVACLEIRENKLCQAKLKFNRAVHEDAKINAAVVDWCRKARITIHTRDVQQPIDITVTIQQPSMERVA